MATHNLPNASNASVRLYKRIALTFIGLTLVLLGVVLAATLSRAVIVVTPKFAPVKAEVKVTVAADVKTAETIRGMVVATTVSGEKVGVPDGTGTVKTGKASGTVLLVNKRASPQALIATTRLLSKDGVLFRLVKGVNIPAGGELKDVAVIADQAGAASEIGPTNFTIPGLPADLQKVVYAFSEKPMAGGVTTEKVVSQKDIDQAINALKDDLVKQASAALASQVAGRGFAGSATLVDEEARSVSAKDGDAVSSFTVLLKLKVTGVFYDKEKLDRLSLTALRANLPADMELGTEDVTFGQVVVQNADANAGTATLAASYGGQAIITKNSAVLDKSRLVGLDVSTLQAYLKSFESISEVTVKLSPFWVTRVPTMKDHITIIIK